MPPAPHNLVEILMQPPRILPLLSSATEVIHALGLGEFQIGRSHECDFPACVADLPVCSSPAIPIDGSSAEIDRLVKGRLANALSIYNVDSNLIAKLQPTHIITQTQCKVCAVSLEDVELALHKQIGSQAKIISLEPYSLADVFADIRRIGAAFDRSDRAASLINEMQQRMAPVNPIRRPRVAALEWLEPLMAAGNWVPELIEMAGAENCFGIAGQHSPWMTWEQLIEADPDVIIAMPCGFNLARTRVEMHWLTERPSWQQLKAIQNGQVYICDGNQYLNRPGPRLADSFELLRDIFHSDAYPPANCASGWEVFAR